MENVFNVVEEIQEKQSKSAMFQRNLTTKSFEVLIEEVKAYFDGYFQDDTIENRKKQERLELQHQAVIGDKETEVLLTNEIQSYLSSINVSDVPFPSYYNSLPEALFHEIYRFGILQKWYVLNDSSAAKFVGNEFWIEQNDVFVKQPEVLSSEQSIYEFIQRFMAGQKNLKVNESNPYEEIALKDQTRVTIVIPPASYKPTLIFRKYTVKNLTFDEQAKLGTIPSEDIDFYKTFSSLSLNSIIAGHIKSGKSTFLKTIYGARDTNMVAVLIEGTPETFLKQDYPDRLVHELYTENQDIHQTMRRALRIDHNYVIVQEVRGVEADGAIDATERGRRGLLMSYHITDPENTTLQLSQHIVDEYPNRHQANEIRRIAKALDIGITMESTNGQKRVTSMYEIGLHEDTNQPFINYLVWFNAKTNNWEYNPKISTHLIKRMNEVDEDLASYFLKHLESRSSQFPMNREHEVNMSFGGFKGDF